MARLTKNIFILLFCGLLAGAWVSQAAAAREVQINMALDISGSMKRTDPLRLLPKAAHIMVELLNEKDRLGILTFEDVTLTRLAPAPLTPGHKRRGFQELTRLQPRGLYTDIHQVLAAAFKAYGPPGQGQRALLLISDGQMDIDPLKGNSKTFVERVHQEIIPAYKKAGIPIYTVAFTPESDQALLKTLADQTGGRFLLISEAKDLHRAFTNFYEALKGPQMAPLVRNRFVIDALVQEAILVVTRSTQGKAVTLEDPKGRKLGPDSAGVRWFAAPTFDMVTLPRPEPGNWTVSGHKEGDGKIILITDLKLELPHLPGEAGADEALMAGALLVNKDQPVTAPEVLNQTVFTAELSPEGGKPGQLQLGAPPVEQKELWPPGARAGRFPAFGTPGLWRLQIRAMSKTFQRERNIFLKVSTPWYKAQPVTAEGISRVEFQPGPGREALQLAGCISSSAPDGGVSGKFVKLPPGGGFVFAFPPGLSGSYRVSARLTGATVSGRPLMLELAPVRVDLTPKAAAAKIGPKSAAAATSKGSGAAAAGNRKRLWIALSLAGMIALLAASAFLYRFRPWRSLSLKSAGDRAAAEVSEDIPPDRQNLLLREQVATLHREKGKLQEELEQKEQELRELLAAKEELEAKLGQPSREYQEKNKMIRELEKRLEDAEREAKSVQEEYMALYARSQQEKKEMKKN